ncbi:MAG TPA: hypothetical protein VF189_02645 [Patescibacteria group bacterium]
MRSAEVGKDMPTGDAWFTSRRLVNFLKKAHATYGEFNPGEDVAGFEAIPEINVPKLSVYAKEVLPGKSSD